MKLKEPRGRIRSQLNLMYYTKSNPFVNELAHKSPLTKG